MKITLDIADDLFTRVQRLARKEKTTFRALTEAGLRLVLAGKHQGKNRELPKLVTFGKSGSTDEFKAWDWEKTRAEVYKDHGTRA